MKYKEFYKHLLKENTTPQWNTNIDVVLNDGENEIVFVINQVTRDLWLEEKNNIPRLIAEIKGKPEDYGRLEDYEYLVKKLKWETEEPNGEEFYDDLPNHPRGMGQTPGSKYLTPSDGKDIKEGDQTFSIANSQPKGRLSKEVVIEIHKILKSMDKPLPPADV